MTSRVFDFQRQDAIAAAASSRAALADARRAHRGSGVGAAFLAAPPVVVLAGAGDQPAGWLAGAMAAAVVLMLVVVFKHRLPWGWLAVVCAGAGLLTPRGPWPEIGPALFTATVLSAVVWLASRGPHRRRSDRPAPGSREHAAQVSLGVSGERHVGQVLAAELPQTYALLNGLKLPRGAGDIDHLVVGPTGVFLLETKTMAGHIVCEADGTWHRTRVGRSGTPYDAYIGDPAAQVLRNIFAVRQALRRRLPALFNHTSLWIEGLVVFPHPGTELATNASRVPAVLLDEAAQRICQHTPRRGLQTHEVDAVVAALLDERRADLAWPTRQSAQALAELAIVLPVVLALVFGTLLVSRIVQARSAAIAVAHEAARAAALANSPSEAIDRMRQRADLVAPGLGLDPHRLMLSWDLSHFDGDPSEVVARVEYPVNLGDLPIVGGAPTLLVQAEHIEWLDPFRSGLSPRSQAAR
jgi:hypothetical protein